MKQTFTFKKFSFEHLAVIDQANEIIEEYMADGYDLTLRQLYYQFVARDLLENTQKKYKWLGGILKTGRLCGKIDWDAIKDRTRTLRRVGTWTSPKAILSTAARTYKLDKWEGQENRVEVWIEKDALIGVIDAVCSDNQINYTSCRGYSSLSFMYETAKRIKDFSMDNITTTILHLGDHDPSGVDMSRDISSRLYDLSQLSEEEDYGFEQFNLNGGPLFNVNRIGLNMDQVDYYNPPPNPTKLTDTRSKDYILDYGHSCWELDALEPSVINTLIQDEIDDIRDNDKWLERIELEKEHKAQLTDFMEKF